MSVSSSDFTVRNSSLPSTVPSQLKYAEERGRQRMRDGRMEGGKTEGKEGGREEEREGGRKRGREEAQQKEIKTS